MSGTLSRRAGLALLLAAVLTLAAWPARADRASRTTPVVLAVRTVSPAVVNISTLGRRRVNPFITGDAFLDRFFEEFWGRRASRQRSLGSGVIIDGNAGLIATNHHVIAAASQIRVQLADKRVFLAQVVGADPSSDLAVLRIKAKKPLPQAKLGDSDDLMIGERVIAIGNPFGLSHTVTTGVVSALDRRVPFGRTTLSGLIQIDASINPGNSGGPLLNADGEVIGINTAIFRQAQGIGFAIPVNQVRRIIGDLVRYGEVVPAWLGLELQTLTPRLARAFGLDRDRGVVVVGVLPRSPAAEAGIKRGTVVAAVNGRAVDSAGHYLELLSKVSAGSRVTLTLQDARGRRELVLQAQAFPLQWANELAWRILGLRVKPLNRELAYRHGVSPDAAVAIAEVRPGSRAEALGLRRGDLLRAIGGRPTGSLGAFQREMARNRLQSRITVSVQRGHASAHLTLGR